VGDGNLYAALRAGFPADLDAPAVETADGAARVHTWRDLERRSAQIAALLTSLRLPAAARIAAQTDKSVEALIVYLAVLRAGLVYVPLNSAYQPAEIEYFLADAEPAVIICTSRNVDWMWPLAARYGTKHVFTLDDDAAGSLLDRAATSAPSHAVAARHGDDVACLLYTSGTTGRSKGAMLTHGNMLANARVLHDFWHWQADDVLIHALPIFHVHGLFVAAHAALLAGSKMFWFSKFDAPRIISRLHEATVFMGVPTMYTRLLADTRLTADACRRMRVFISGSAPLSLPTFDAFRARTGHTIVERYGMSETIMLTSNPVRGERRAGTVGPALPGVGLRVHGGATGEVEVNGPSVFAGYWRRPTNASAEFTADGWFKTGDVGQLDADGYLTIVGRSKDLIISGGFNVYPAEIEAALAAITGIADSAVIGIAHPDFGEGVVAVIVAHADASLCERGVLDALQGRLANFKTPKRVFVVEELPRNVMGKVQKNALRQQYQGCFS
jgi:malonyl-CoA/methylmalonyl-CoA synthetase